MSRTRLTRAVLLLETLCSEENIPILELLREKGRMTLAELYSKTGESPARLEVRLQSLCDTGCVTMEEARIGSNAYQLNPERIRQVNNISRRIGQITTAGLRERSAQ
jgi:DNA-binding IclR family transcriptional regulator